MHAQNRLATGSTSYNVSKEVGLRRGRLRGLHSTQLPLRRGRFSEEKLCLIPSGRTEQRETGRYSSAGKLNSSPANWLIRSSYFFAISA